MALFLIFCINLYYYNFVLKEKLSKHGNLVFFATTTTVTAKNDLNKCMCCMNLSFYRFSK